MENSLKRRDQMQQQQQQHPSSHPADLNDDDKDLISPYKRLRLSDSPGEPSISTTQHFTNISETLEQDILYNTPEKARRDITSSHEDLLHPYNSTLEKSEQGTEEDPSGLSGLEQPCLDQNRYYQCGPPQDEILLCTPVKVITYEAEEEEGMMPTSPLPPIPHNTPEERSVILEDDDDDSDGEDIFINTTTSEANDFNPVPSITFADRTNLDGVRQPASETQDSRQGCSSERSVTFADQTNIQGAQRIHDLPERVPHPERQVQRTENVIPRSRFPSVPNPLPSSVGETHSTHSSQGEGVAHSAYHQQQPPRFGSVGNLCPEELDHHRLSLQSYGSVAHFEHQQRGMTAQQHPFVRSTSHRSVFQPQNLHSRFNQAHTLAGPNNREQFVDYGSIDGPGNWGIGGDLDVQQSEVVDYGSVDLPLVAAAPGTLKQSRQTIHSSADNAPSSARLWYYGSIDDPRRIVSSSVQSLNAGSDQFLQSHHHADAQISSGHPGGKNEQPFVRSASRRTLPRLCSQGTAGKAHGNSDRDLQDAPESRPSSRPALDQIREVAETSNISAKTSGSEDWNQTSKNSRGTLCVLSDSGNHGNQGLNQGLNLQGCEFVHGPRPPQQQHHHHHPSHHFQQACSARLSGSSGSHAELISQGSAGGRADVLAAEKIHAYGSQGSGKTRSKSGGGSSSTEFFGSSQHSSESQPSAERGGEAWGQSRQGHAVKGHQSGDLCAANRALIGGSRKRRVLETSGQIKVSLYLNSGLVTVYVMQGRHFTCNWKAHCDSYIKLSLIPEESGRKLRLKSKPMVNTNNPFFDHKFSLELQDSDENKRLLISIWHKDLKSGCSEFLGCTSFGVNSILRRKEVNGWYYLLTEQVGKQKHLQVTHTPQFTKSKSSHSIPQINKDVLGLESFVFHMERGKHGFGFRLSADSCPAQVDRVDLGSPAAEAGLMVKDYIIKVNHKNVSRSTVSGVTSLIKQSGHMLILHINRSVEKPSEPTAPHDKPDNTTGRKPDPVYESIGGGTLPDRSEFTEENKENEMTVDTRFEASSVCETFSKNRVSTSTPLLTARKMDKHGGGDADGDEEEEEGPVTEEQRKVMAIHRLLSLEMDFIDFMQLGIERYTRPLRHYIFSTAQHNTVFQNIEKLVNISEYHVQQIQDNAPSMYTESEDDDSQASDERHFASAVAMIYFSKAHMFCQAHEAYAGGLSEANRVLSDMRRNEDFLTFIKDPPPAQGQPSISAFIFRPLQHIKELSSVFQEIYLHTPTTSVDHATLKKVTHVLAETVRTISTMSNARVQSLTSLSSHTRSSTTTTSGGRGSWAASSLLSSTGDSGSEGGRGIKSGTDSLRTTLQTLRAVDREVLRMQDRLVFSHNVPVFQLCHEDRHIIYQGDVFYLHDSHWSKIQMTLFSDLVMLCQPDREGSLHVLCNPIFLQDIGSVHTHPDHTTELVLTLCPITPNGSAHPCPQSLVFRTPSPEDVSTWKKLLDHRLTRTQNSNTTTTTQEESEITEPPPTPTSM